MIMRLQDCYNFEDFRKLARRRLPGPIFNYIDGAADDEVTHQRNTTSYQDYELIPNVLRGGGKLDTTVDVLGRELAVPFYCSPTALQRLFHHEGERAVASASANAGTLFGVSTLGTVSVTEMRKKYSSPQTFQFYFHKDRELNKAMLTQAKAAGVDSIMLTVDSITGGNRERDLRTGFSIPFRLNMRGIFEFAVKPTWGLQFMMHEKFSLPQLDDHVDFKSDSLSLGRYFTEMLDPTMTWDDVAELVEFWDGEFCLKGVMSTKDALRARDIGCTGIVISNHGGRQLDGVRAPIDQLGDIRQAIGGDFDILIDGGVKRGTHILKALARGATAVGIGRYYLFGLSIGGERGVQRVLDLLTQEVTRGMQLLGVRSISEINEECVDVLAKNVRGNLIQN